MQKAPLGRPQVRQHGPIAVDDAEEVDIHHAAQLLGRELLGLGVDGHDRVRDVGVDAAEALDRGLDHALDLRPVGDVARDGERF